MFTVYNYVHVSLRSIQLSLGNRVVTLLRKKREKNIKLSIVELSVVLGGTVGTPYGKCHPILLLSQ